MADKTIFELNIASAGIITGDWRFPGQKNTITEDYGIKFSDFLSWMGQNTTLNLTVYGGASNPISATGKNGDIYFQTNGNVYQKISGGWALKVNISGNPAFAFTRNSGTTYRYTLSAPQLANVNAFGRYPTFAAFISGLQYDDIYPIYTGSPGSFTSVVVQLHDDGTGNNPDTTVVQFS